MRHFSHRRKKTAFSSRDSFPYNESPHDSYPQFPRSSLGTRGLQTRSHRKKKKKKRSHFKSLALAKASETNYVFSRTTRGKRIQQGCIVFHTVKH